MKNTPRLVMCPDCGQTREIFNARSTTKRCQRCYWDSMKVSDEQKKKTARAKQRRLYHRHKDKIAERQKAWSAANRETLNLKARERYQLDPARRRARNAVHRAVTSGKLVRGLCERCGSPDVQAHHDDYSRPLDVRWLCRDCHGLHHRKDGE